MNEYSECKKTVMEDADEGLLLRLYMVNEQEKTMEEKMAASRRGRNSGAQEMADALDFLKMMRRTTIDEIARRFLGIG